ncbi:hypothetical protein ACFL6U_05440 [Planctomycetota bacterium]
MKQFLWSTILVALSCSLGNSQAIDSVWQEHSLVQISPPWQVAAYRFEDLNNDHVHELLVIGEQGQIKTWSGQVGDDVVFHEVGESWSLPFPKKSLVALSSFSGNEKNKVLATLTPEGLYAYPVNEDGSVRSAGVLVNRRMKFQLRVGQPVFSNFMQDINQDGQRDILVPQMNRCEIWINGGFTADTSTLGQESMPTFSRMGTFSVKMAHGRSTDMGNTTGTLSEYISIPSLLLKDINGDEYLDLVVRHESKYDYYILDQEGRIPDTPTASLDLSLFQDTTPVGEEVQFGETLNIGGKPQLTESDLNNDTIPDYVISHRRKLWFFHGTDQGPQFTDPSSIIKIAEDITLFLVCLLDEDDYPDLLMLKVKIPTLSRLLQALFADWEVKTESIGYQSKQGQSFELSSTWQGEVFLHLPSILSMINNPDIVKEFEVDKQYGRPVHGDFNGDGSLDVVMVKKKTGHYEMWFGAEGEQETRGSTFDDPKELGAKIRKLLFTKTDNVWDITRIKKAMNSLMNEQVFAVTGGKDPNLHLAQFKDLQNVQAISVDFDHDETDELFFVYAHPQANHLTVFELYAIREEYRRGYRGNPQ